MNRTSQFTSVLLTRILSCMLGLSFALSSGLVHAATQTANLSVSATVAANCTITTAAVAFGAYDPVVANATTALNGSGTVTTKCTNGSAVAISLGQGANAATGSTAAAPLRRMISGTNFLSYQLYRDSARTAVWAGDATTDVDITGTGADVVSTVFGSVTSGQNVPVGSYSDTVIATVTF